MSHFHAKKRHKREYAEITGGHPGQLVQMEFMIHIDDSDDTERDDRERPYEDADPARGSELHCRSMFPAEKTEKSERLREKQQGIFFAAFRDDSPVRPWEKRACYQQGMEKEKIEIVREVTDPAAGEFRNPLVNGPEEMAVLSVRRQAPLRYLHGDKRQTCPGPPHEGLCLEPTDSGHKNAGK